MTDSAELEIVARSLCVTSGEDPDHRAQYTVMMVHRSTGPTTPPAAHPETIVDQPSWTYYIRAAKAVLDALEKHRSDYDPN